MSTHKTDSESRRSGGGETGSAPVWLAALRAAHCEAKRPASSSQPVVWLFDGEQAYYANPFGETVVIEPMDISLAPRQALAITWERGETCYSVRRIGGPGRARPVAALGAN